MSGPDHPIGERHLWTAVKEHTEHYHLERNHQGLDNKLIEKSGRESLRNAPVDCRERLGGVLRYYWRAA